MTAIFERVQKSFERQGMMQHLDARLVKVEHGLVELVLPYSDKVTQQQDGFHGGAMGAVADIAGGYAALTVTPEGSEVVTVEYKINFLGSFKGGELRATGRVVKGGKRIIVTTAEVVHVDDEGKTSPCAVPTQVGCAPRLTTRSAQGSAWAWANAAAGSGRPKSAWWSSSVTKAVLASAKARSKQVRAASAEGHSRGR